MAIRLGGSQVAVAARQGFDDAKKVLSQVAVKFATGQKYARPADNLFASVEASIGEAQLTYTSSALSTLTRLRALLATRNGSLNTMRDSVQVLSDIALQASGSLPADVRTANINVFNQVLARVANIAQTSDYAGVKLLNGTFGAAGDLEISNPVYNVLPTASTALAAIQPDIEIATGTIAITNATALSTITIGGEVFTYVSTNADPEQNQILLGNTDTATAINTLQALNKSTKDGVKKYHYSIDSTASNVIQIKQLATTDAVMSAADFDSSDNAVTLTVTYDALVGANPAFNMSKVTGTSGASLLGQVGSITLASRTVGGTRGEWEAYNTAAGYTTPVYAGAADPADTLSKFTFKIGDTDYNAYHFTDMSGGNAGGTIALNADIDQKLFCIKASEDTSGAILAGKVFTINLAADPATDMGTAATMTANTNTFITNFNTDAAKLTFKQSNFMKIDTTGGDIIHNNVAIGSVAGLTAVLTTSNFDDLKVTSVECAISSMTITMEDSTGAKKVFTASTQAYYQAGEVIVLKESGTDDELMLTLGGKEDLDLTTEDYRKTISQALQNALGSSEASSFIVGTSVDQKLAVNLNNMSWSVITGGTALSIDTQANSQIASEVLANVVNTLNSEIALTAAYDKAVDSLMEQMNVSQQNLAASVEELSSIDIADTRQDLDVALRVYNACIGALMADNKASELLQRLLQI